MRAGTSLLSHPQENFDARNVVSRFPRFEYPPTVDAALS